MKKISIIALVILIGLLAGCNSSKETDSTGQGVSTSKTKVDIMNEEETSEVSEEDETLDWDDLVLNITDYTTEELLALYTDSEGDYASVIISELTSRYYDNPKDVLSLICTAENVDVNVGDDEDEDTNSSDEDESTGNVFRHQLAYNIGYELKSKDLTESELAKLISGEGLDLTGDEQTYFQDIVDGYETQ